MFQQAKWITVDRPTGDVVPELRRAWQIDGSRAVKAVSLTITALGV